MLLLEVVIVSQSQWKSSSTASFHGNRFNIQTDWLDGHSGVNNGRSPGVFEDENSFQRYILMMASTVHSGWSRDAPPPLPSQYFFVVVGKKYAK